MRYTSLVKVSFALQIFFHLRLVLAFNTPYIHFCPSSDSKTEPKSTSSLSKQTRDFNHTHSLTSMQ